MSCPGGAVAAGVYTQNLVYSPAVAFDRARTPLSDCLAVVTNSGNANTCTGERGVRDNAEMAGLAAKAAGDPQATALVMSTGIIGEYLPMEKVRRGIASAGKQLATGNDAFLQAARGILTTDRGVKIATRSLQGSSMAGMAKGAGMIGPRMATMLSLITTDAALRVRDAQAALRQAVDRSFNRIRVEGHMSTSDTVLLLANGASGAPALQGDSLESFTAELTGLCVELAKMIPDDGEGASHLIEVHVEGAEAEEEGDSNRAGDRRQPAGESRHRRQRPQLGAHYLGGRICWPVVRCAGSRPASERHSAVRAGCARGLRPHGRASVAPKKIAWPASIFKSEADRAKPCCGAAT